MVASNSEKKSIGDNSKKTSSEQYIRAKSSE